MRAVANERGRVVAQVRHGLVRVALDDDPNGRGLAENGRGTHAARRNRCPGRS